MHGTQCRVGIGLLRLTASVVLLGFAGSAHAERLPIKAYTVESGLAHNRVKRIVQDSHGFLWFCTAAGLSRFDGYQFTNYTTENGFPSLSINDLVEGGTASTGSRRTAMASSDSTCARRFRPTTSFRRGSRSTPSAANPSLTA